MSRENVLHVFALILLTATAGRGADLFEGHGDIGGPKLAGSVEFDPNRGAYTITGGGANMWFTNDALHFVWKKVSGDVTLSAEVSFQGQGGDPHRKACLLIRQSLATDAAYADAALHGDGLTSLQYRPANGERTYEIQSAISAPRRLRIEKRGRYLSMSLAGPDGAWQPSGGAFRLELTEPFYVGLGVCAHNNDRLETAVFSKVQLQEGPGAAAGPTRMFSTLETVTLSSKDRRVVWITTNHIEAPNWPRQGSNLLVNTRAGRILRVPLNGLPAEAHPERRLGQAAEPVNTGFATRCNNDHGLSPDGTLLVISDQSQRDRKSRIYTLPVAGGTPRLVTESGPSYWHGWSPDGRRLVYCAERGGEFDVYSIAVDGGTETRLTTAKGLDDGPDYSPDGQWIYFNSDRDGAMQIWRMRVDGSAQEQVTNDEYNNWFPHPSPDGRWLVFVSYEKEVKGHPENKDVTLRVMPLAGGKIEVLAKLFGGQGTINVPSWSPDSRRVAFVSYQFAP